jgi:hypothetical protein
MTHHVSRRTLTCVLAAAFTALAFATVSAAPAPAATGSQVRSDVRKAPAAKRGGKAERPIAKASSPQRFCPIEDLPVPESSSTGVVTAWIGYGQSITVTPSLSHNIWAGVWFTGQNGPEGWANTWAPGYYPLPGAREYSLIGRFGSGSWHYIGQQQRTYTNTSPGYIERARFRVNDNTPGNGSGAFQVRISYPCYYA